MRDVLYAPAFKKDRVRVAERGNNLEELITIVEQLARDGHLPSRFRPHKLRGAYEGWWECHIIQNWLLVYAVTPSQVILFRTGSHEDLFE